MADTLQAGRSVREDTLRRRLKGDLLNLVLAGAAGKLVKEATGFALETVDKLLDEREAEVRRTISVRAAEGGDK